MLSTSNHNARRLQSNEILLANSVFSDADTPGANPSNTINENAFQGMSWLGHNEKFAAKELCENALIEAVFRLWPNASIKKNSYDGVFAEHLDVYSNGVTFRHAQCVQLIEEK